MNSELRFCNVKGNMFISWISSGGTKKILFNLMPQIRACLLESYFFAKDNIWTLIPGLTIRHVSAWGL